MPALLGDGGGPARALPAPLRRWSARSWPGRLDQESAGLPDPRRSPSPQGRGAATPPGSSPLSPGCWKPRARADSRCASISTSRSRGSGNRPTAWSQTTRPPSPSGMAAVQLLGYAARRNGTIATCSWLFCGRTSRSGLQQAAVAALGRTNDPKVADRCSSRLEDATHPQVRTAILDTLLSRPDWTSSLLSSLEDGCVPPAEIDPARRQQLLTRRAPGFKARAERRLRPSKQAPAGRRRRLSPGTRDQGRPSRRRGRLQEAVCVVPPVRQ